MSVSKFPIEDERAVIEKVINYSACADVAIQAAIKEINSDIKKEYGAEITKFWFSEAVRRHKDLFEMWMDAHRFKAMVAAEEADERRKVFEAKLYGNEETEVMSPKGEVVKLKQRKLQHADIQAYRAIDQSERRRIASMLPGLYQEKPPEGKGDDPVAGGIHIHLDKKGSEDVD